MAVHNNTDGCGQFARTLGFALRYGQPTSGRRPFVETGT